MEWILLVWTDKWDVENEDNSDSAHNSKFCAEPHSKERAFTSGAVA